MHKLYEILFYSFIYLYSTFILIIFSWVQNESITPQMTVCLNWVQGEILTLKNPACLDNKGLRDFVFSGAIERIRTAYPLLRRVFRKVRFSLYLCGFWAVLVLFFYCFIFLDFARFSASVFFKLSPFWVQIMHNFMHKKSPPKF